MSGAWGPAPRDVPYARYLLGRLSPQHAAQAIRKIAFACPGGIRLTIASPWSKTAAEAAWGQLDPRWQSRVVIVDERGRQVLPPAPPEST